MPSVMLVDDCRDSSEALMHFLSKSGHSVRCVENGRQALVEVITNPPDVIVLDLLMPQMDGASFLEVVRSYLRLQSLPVVVLTALQDSLLIKRVRHLNVSSILAKGKASFEDIRQAIEEALLRSAPDFPKTDFLNGPI